MKTLLLALGFMAVFEGIMPLVAPELWQRSLERLSRMDPETIRRFAFAVISIGLAVVWTTMTFV